MPDFHPSPAQRRLLDWLLDHPGAASIQQLCRDSATPRSTFYVWYRDPAFRAWFIAAWSSQLIFEGIPLVNLARALAPQDFRYWKALFDLTFDPKGLAMMHHWQAALAALPVQAEIQQNQALPAASLDKNPRLGRASHAPARSTPRNHIRWLQKSLGALHRASGRAGPARGMPPGSAHGESEAEAVRQRP